jgi:predicted dehydrogenase
MPNTRRTFLTAAATALSYGRILGANDRIRLGGLGTGGRCRYLLDVAVNKLDGAELAAVCDVYSPRRDEARSKLGASAREFADYRELLEQKDIDAVVIGSPDHWHVPMTIDAIRAGKDVYVEKPVSHSIAEGEALLSAAAASDRIVQVGYQQRSWEHFIQAAEIVQSGKLGRVTQVQTSWYQNYPRMTANLPEVDTAKLDWKRFLGSAPEQPFEKWRFLQWRWYWDFGGGHLTDLFSHYGDVAQWYMKSDSPQSAMAIGSVYLMEKFQCPDTTVAMWNFPAFELSYTGTLSGSLDGGTLVFRGTQAMMRLNRDGFNVYEEGKVPFEKTHYPPPAFSAQSKGDGTIAHMRNFLECVRSRNQPNCPVSPAVAAARTAHLANQALRKS